MRLIYIANALGIILKYISVVVFIPILVALFTKDFNSIIPFSIAGLLSFIFGVLLKDKSATLEKLNDIKKSEALMVVSLCWALFAFIAAIPYLFYGLTPLNALFEGISGITTTGATIFENFDYPKTIIFWRSFTQWLGGMGIIVLFVAILPQFAVAGRQMFFAEAPGPTEDKITPRIKNTATTLWVLYASLTFICFLLLYIAGMPLFDSICNSMSTMSAGGLCPNSKSIAGYNSNIINWIVILFMFLSGCSFVLQSKVISKKKFSLFFKSEEFMCYLFLVVLFSLVLTISLFVLQKYSLFHSFTAGIYQVLSFATSTGSSSEDYQLWNFTSKLILFLSGFISSCAGSAGGGIKITRWIIIFKYIKNELYKILHPNAVITIKIDDKVVSPDVIKQTIFFVFCFFLFCAFSAIILTLLEGNITIGITSSISSLGCIGPGFGNFIGPMASYANLKPISKVLLMFNMMVGRLEIIPFLVLFHKDFWKIK